MRSRPPLEPDAALVGSSTDYTTRNDLSPSRSRAKRPLFAEPATETGTSHARLSANLCLQRREAGGLNVICLKLGQSSRQRAKQPGPFARSAGTAVANLDIRTDLQIAGILR
jgi:hypothetical protein